MSDYQHPNKNRRAEIFGARRSKVSREGKTAYVTLIKRRHPKGTKLWAYVRMLTSSEGAVQVNVGEERYLVIINYNKDVKMGDYVRLNDKLLQIALPPDVYEDRKFEMKLTCVRVEELEGPLEEEQ